MRWFRRWFGERLDGQKIYRFESMWESSFPLGDDPDKGRAREEHYGNVTLKAGTIGRILLPGSADELFPETPEDE